MKSVEVDGFAYLCNALMLEDSPGPVALSVFGPATGEFLEHCQLQQDPHYKATWDTSYAMYLVVSAKALAFVIPQAQCVGGTNTFFLINYHGTPSHKKEEICHTIVICEVQPEKDDPNCIRITIGGNCICYPGNIGTNTASFELVKLLINSNLSQKGACFSSIDLENFYLDTPMPNPEYVQIKIPDIPEEFIKEYKLTGRDHYG